MEVFGILLAVLGFVTALAAVVMGAYSIHPLLGLFVLGGALYWVGNNIADISGGV